MQIEAMESSEADCLTFQLKFPERSMLPADLSSKQEVIALLPIQRIFTLYLDRSGTLRYLGHAAEQNIENQPIADGLSAISHSPKIENELTTLHSLLNFETGRSQRLILRNRLSTRNLDELLFQKRKSQQ